MQRLTGGVKAGGVAQRDLHVQHIILVVPAGHLAKARGAWVHEGQIQWGRVKGTAGMCCSIARHKDLQQNDCTLWRHPFLSTGTPASAGLHIPGGLLLRGAPGGVTHVLLLVSHTRPRPELQSTHGKGRPCRNLSRPALAAGPASMNERCSWDNQQECTEAEAGPTRTGMHEKLPSRSPAVDIAVAAAAPPLARAAAGGAAMRGKAACLRGVQGMPTQRACTRVCTKA